VVLGYKIDGVELNTWGVQVERVDGISNFLKRKGDMGFSYPDEDGIDSYNTDADIKYEARDILLHCRIEAATASQYFVRLNFFKKLIMRPGTRTLEVPYTSETFEVEYKEGSKINNLTSFSANTLVNTFYVKFVEPTPVRPS